MLLFSLFHKIRNQLCQIYQQDFKIAEIDAIEILSVFCSVEYQDLYLKPEKLIDYNVVEKILYVVDRIASQEPIAYVLERKYFWNNYFKVNCHTLIPRSDSEILIQAAASYMKSRFSTVDRSSVDKKINILDLCSGTGCLLLSIMKELNEQAELGIGIDISAEAKIIAEHNANAMGLSSKCIFHEFNIFNLIEDRTIFSNMRKFDLIVSNPPYISLNEYFELPNTVKDTEPRLALTDEMNGLSFYPAIFAVAQEHLAKSGFLIIEICHHKIKEIEEIISHFKLNIVEYLLDISQNKRGIVCQL